MEREKIMEALAREGDYVSGEELSRQLGVTRAAVWKEIAALRQAGWEIQSSPRKGYRLLGQPPALNAAYLSGALPAGSLFAGKILVEQCVDSTNTQLKARAVGGAPEGTVLLAEEQTGGRGTRGRGFFSPRGTGLYLSVLLRPDVSLAELLPLTGWVAVAAHRGILRACGAPAEIKWLNDLYLHGKKLCGMLTEVALLGESGEPDYAVVGIGVNVGQSRADFAAQGLEKIATSLAAEGFSISRSRLCLCLLESLEQMSRDFPAKRREYLEYYRGHNLTVGRAVRFERDGRELPGIAQGVNEEFGLTVRGDDGRLYQVASGTVSLR